MPEKEKSAAVSGYEYALSLTGGKAAPLSRIAGVTPQAVSQWRQRGVVPPEAAKKIAKIFGVPRERLNPVFGKD